MRLNIPTWLTFLRIFMIPFFMLFFYLPVKHAPLTCTLIFILASITDWFDGFLARRWKQTTCFGTFLDPVADKIMVSTALVMLSEHYHSWWITLPSSIIIIREIIISALREWMAKIGKCSSVGVSWVAKLKTTTQMLALIALLWHPDDIVLLIGITALYAASVLTFFSMFKYIYDARRDLFKY